MPVALAHNPRTATLAAIHRASASARSNMNRFDRSTLTHLQNIYQQAAGDIQAAIAAAADGDGVLRLTVLNDLQNQVNQVLGQLDQSSQQLLNGGLNRAAELGVNTFDSVLNSASLTRAGTQAVEFVQNFVAADGLQLSDRFWRVQNHAQQIVGNAIESAIIQGHSASEAVNNLLNQGIAVPGDLRNKLNLANAGSVSRASYAALMTGEGSPRSNALRLFRTELNRAHGEAYMLAGGEHEDFAGWKFLLSPRHPEVDICDMHARVNRYGLGEGVYPSRKDCPWPAHPNTLSYVEIVFKDEITDDDRAGKQTRIDWLNNQISLIQHGVLNSRGKQGMLHAGILNENQIATPWNVLQNRLINQGIDPSTLVIKPTKVSESGFDVSEVRDAAYRHVLMRGTRKGNDIEYLAAYDMNTGIQHFTHTSLTARSVSLKPDQLSLLSDPSRRFEIVHNHPSSSSLSLPDLRFTSSLPGVKYITAVGHNGTVYRASINSGITPDMFTVAHDHVSDFIQDRMWPLVRSNTLTPDQAGLVHQHLTNLAFDRLNFIEYSTTHLSDELIDSMGVFNDDVTDFLTDLTNHVEQELLR